MSLPKRAPSWGEKWTFCCCFGSFCLFFVYCLSFPCKSTFTGTRANLANEILEALFSTPEKGSLSGRGSPKESTFSTFSLQERALSLAFFLDVACDLPGSPKRVGLLRSGIITPYNVCMHGVIFYVVITAYWTLCLPCFYLSSVIGLGTSF